MNIKELKILFSAVEIQSRIQDMANNINAHYKDESLVVVCVLKGAFMFFSDLVRLIENKNLQTDFVRISSYGAGTESSENVIMRKDIELNLSGKHVLIVEDIIDSGNSMHFLLNDFLKRGALSVKLAVLIDKKERRQIDITPDFIGFYLDTGFIVGYGLDYAEQYRQLPAIYEVVMA